MNGSVSWKKENASAEARDARQVQACAEDLVERMRALEMALAIKGRYEDVGRVEEALGLMKVVAGALRWQPSTPTPGSSASAC